MDKSGYNFPSWYFMSKYVYNIFGLRAHGRFYTGVISQYQQHWVSNGSVGLCISWIGRVRARWDEYSSNSECPLMDW